MHFVIEANLFFVIFFQHVEHEDDAEASTSEVCKNDNQQAGAPPPCASASRPSSLRQTLLPASSLRTALSRRHVRGCSSARFYTPRLSTSPPTLPPTYTYRQAVAFQGGAFGQQAAAYGQQAASLLGAAVGKITSTAPPPLQAMPQHLGIGAGAAYFPPELILQCACYLV